MIYYAIMHVPTGGFLPEPPGHLRSRGYTYSEPTLQFPPRLFKDEASAKRARTWWLKGITSVTLSRDWESGVSDGEDWHTEKKEDRRPEEVAVVAVSLVLMNSAVSPT